MMLNLEKDLLVTEEDYAAMRTPPSHDPKDLKSYLDFLEAIGAFDSRNTRVVPYPEPFRLVD